MTKHIYKYFGPDLVNIVLTEGGATLKFSKPKDFNDPYELFLTVDYSIDPGALAAYQELVGNIPQLPTTCFSSSPAVPPMWAHYGQNGTGFVIEFDEEAISEEFTDCRFGDVTYRDSANEDLTEMLYKAHVIGKPRYTYFLRNGVFFTSYFTKATCWSYERERRMIAEESSVKDIGELQLLDVPKQCIRSIIAGPNASTETLATLKKIANSMGYSYYETRIGRSNITPFFVDSSNQSHVFDGSDIVDDTNSCDSCNEPISTDSDRCSWCQVTDDHRRHAAISNPYRMIDRYGNLAEYIQQMDEISANISKMRGE